ncbi:HpcH/HpaI aldolase family protein [Modestobacter roseus]|uniref:4-hydroxy-2-oxoheptanedioate aldolase n=1 Tax=Modestobacter roseus TaxID=1181884 RepID=A0A562ISW8_9ACTN|nr:aldolase/citrate lyase family protein [Modestobacter roseus]MQA35115.1 2,4-dihydroxyhept-2-ene-1,7-dioic acid aldolase [Modestobacter roseus]TWH73654.1 4-hydroxy-2-oxoheptanedioate aldolase [Modestobacter roseus]
MRTSLFRAALARGDGPALGTWVKIPAPEVVELVALAGFDVAVIDLEHSPMSLESASTLIATALHTGVSAIVRVPGLDPGLVQRVLDAGAEGVMVPHVDTVEQARSAAAAVRFPPLGERGVGSTSRAGAWGAQPLAEYLRFGQEEAMLIAQIESAAGVRNAEEIAAVDGVDALLVGTVDLAVSEGRTPGDPAVAELVAAVVDSARAAGVPVGNAGAATAEAAQTAVDAGFTFTMLSNDATMLGTAARAAVAAGRSARPRQETR